MKEDRKKNEEKFLENKLRSEFHEQRAKLVKEKIQKDLNEKKMKSMKLFKQNIKKDLEDQKKQFELILQQRYNGVIVTNNNQKSQLEKEMEEIENKYEEDQKISESLLKYEEKIKNSEDIKNDELSRISLNARDMTLSIKEKIRKIQFDKKKSVEEKNIVLKNLTKELKNAEKIRKKFQDQYVRFNHDNLLRKMNKVKTNIECLKREKIQQSKNKLENYQNKEKKGKNELSERPQSIRKMTHIALQNAQRENFERIKILKQNKRSEKIQKLKLLKSKSKEGSELSDLNLKTEFGILEQEKQKLQERVIQTLKPKKKIKKASNNEDNIIILNEIKKEVLEKNDLKFWITEDSKDKSH